MVEQVGVNALTQLGGQTNKSSAGLVYLALALAGR